jgi:hypothetical protein
MVECSGKCAGHVQAEITIGIAASPMAAAAQPWPMGERQAQRHNNARELRLSGKHDSNGGRCVQLASTTMASVAELQAAEVARHRQERWLRMYVEVRAGCAQSRNCNCPSLSEKMALVTGVDRLW